MLQRRVQRALSLSVTDNDLSNSLETLGEFDNTLRARHNLRGDIEQRGVQLAEQMLAALSSVGSELQLVQTTMHELSVSVETVKSRIEVAQTQTMTLLSKADTLKTQRDLAAKRAVAAEGFVHRLLLTSEESQCLASGRVGPAFFAALNRAGEAKQEAQELVRLGHQHSGLEIIESLTSQTNDAYERLQKWIVGECRHFTGPEIEASRDLRSAMTALAVRPEFLRHCLTELSVTRKAALSKAFNDALTRGGPTGSRPIEVHAHDPVRYIGDMLAWLHTAAASEKDALYTLCGISGEPPAQLKNAIEITVGSSFDSVGRPFVARVEQSASGALDAVIAHRLASLLAPYPDIVGKLIGGAGSILEALKQARQYCSKLFEERVNVLLDRLSRAFTHVPATDLGPPSVLLELVSILGGALLQDFETSPTQVSPEAVEGGFVSPASISDTFALRAIDIVDKWSAVGADAVSDVLVLNSFETLSSLFRSHANLVPASIAHVANLRLARLDSLRQHLATSVAEDVIPGLVSLLQGKPSVIGEPNVVKDVLRAFYTSVSHGLSLPYPYARVRSVEDKGQLETSLTEAVKKYYTQVYAAIAALGEEYITAVAPLTPENITTML